jgi:hypothetical protein
MGILWWVEVKDKSIVMVAGREINTQQTAQQDLKYQFESKLQYCANSMDDSDRRILQ